MRRGSTLASDRRLTVVEHLEELRRVLIVSVLAWLLATVGAFFFNGALLGVLLEPLRSILPRANRLLTTPAIITSPTEGLTIPVKVAGVAGFVISLPIILWQAWRFIAPGLRPVERRFAGPFIASSLALFAAGAAFAYFVMPIGLNFLATFLGANATYFPDLDEYLSFFLLLVMVFGITFELPVVIVLLGLLGIVSSRQLRARRRGIWVAIVFVALVVTPGADPFTPTALFVPLIALFEASVLVLDRICKR